LQIFDSLEAAKAIKNPILTLGTFDGVHRGHQHVIQQLSELASAYDGESTLLTFEPHPRFVLQGHGKGIELIQTFDEKKEKLQRYGLQNLICIPFTTEFSNQSAEEFVKNVLVNQLHIKAIVIGHDHRFGKDRSGDFNLLLTLGDRYNFEVLQTNALVYDQVQVSSTKIRAAITQGNIELANNFLNEPFSITGKVIKGQAVGRTIGFPTANLLVQNEMKLIPPKGVYIVTVTLQDGQLYNGVVNIGTRPTVSNDNCTTIEVHILDFEQDIYNQDVHLAFIKKIRDEEQFSTIDELKTQIDLDVSAVRNFFELQRSANQ
jgi:riboflavin kinase / FMN adenylyltransferase